MNSGRKKGLLFVFVCVVSILILYVVWPSKMIEYLTTPASSEGDAANARFSARSSNSEAIVIRKKIPGGLQEVEASFDRNKPIVITKKVPSSKVPVKEKIKIKPSNDISPIPAKVDKKTEQKLSIQASGDATAKSDTTMKPEPVIIKKDIKVKPILGEISKSKPEFAEKEHETLKETKQTAKKTAAAPIPEKVPTPVKEQQLVIANADKIDSKKAPVTLTGKAVEPKEGQEFVPRPYSIMLASCRRMDSAQSVIKQNIKKGLSPYAVRVDLGQKGIWWRVFEGNYTSADEAGSVKKQHKLDKALVRKTPYAISIGAYNSETDAAAEVQRLIKLKHSPYFLPGPENKVRLLVGAYVSKDGARQLHDELTARGISNEVVIR